MAKTESQCILGIDPGSRATGYGVIAKKGIRLYYVTCGVIRLSNKYSFSERLKIIFDGLCEVIANHKPTVAAVEDVFVAANPRTALKLGHARGVAVLAALHNGLPVYDYTPRMVKQAVVGYGNADKHQVQQMVRVLLQLSAVPSADAADALAVAMCHANQTVIDGEVVK
ncbi:MAG: crossover junction endodeoxyribonuclease RuvC [Deltaproteobacteria bacterium]|jgi:crossover junction endodeoxyribonuclease RuvC|nr:crossover junction endodeoxyribonuclease RuvC [Deltaproteobacteria bacterium]